MVPDGRKYLGSITGTSAYLAPLYDKNAFGYSTGTVDKLADGTDNQAAFDRRWVKSGSSSNNTVMALNTDWVVSPTFFVTVTAGYYRANNTTPEDAVGDQLVHVFQYANSDWAMTSNNFPTVPSAYQQASGYSGNISSSRHVRSI